MFVEAGVDNICIVGAILTSLKVKKDTDFRSLTHKAPFFQGQIWNFNAEWQKLTYSDTTE